MTKSPAPRHAGAGDFIVVRWAGIFGRPGAAGEPGQGTGAGSEGRGVAGNLGLPSAGQPV